MTDKIVVLSTCAGLEEARRLANAVLGKGLAACVNLIPGVESIYRWKDRIETSQEFLLVIKTRRELFEKVSAELARVHSYEIPEAVAFQVVDGLQDYLDWIDRELGVTSNP